MPAENGRDPIREKQEPEQDIKRPRSFFKQGSGPFAILNDVIIEKHFLIGYPFIPR